MSSGGDPVQFDDRLATVLRNRADNPAMARTQFRQLLDLLGSRQGVTSPEAAEAGFARLQQLANELPGAVQSAILREPGMRLRNPALVSELALCEPQAAAAAMATARLTDAEWLQLIPRLPLVARGFLRHRRDLPPGARATLQQLGVWDLVLPRPTQPEQATAATAAPAPSAAAPSANRGDGQRGIGDLVRRIAEFRRNRSEAGTSPRLPLAELDEGEAPPTQDSFDFTTDTTGVVRWADPALAAMMVGMPLLASRALAPPLRDRAARQAVQRRQVLRKAAAVLIGPAAIAGEWRIDAAPHFDPDNGSFSGYRGRLRRPAPPVAAPPVETPGGGEADRIRQVLHELRTPVNAIQGFAEIIQQQLFGAVPNEYRALSAAIAVDAARLLGGFEDLDRLARLESGALDLPEGASDLANVLAGQLRRLEGVLRPRSAAIELRGSGPLPVAMDGDDAALLAWRLLAALAGALAPGETITITQQRDSNRVELAAELPLNLDSQDDIFTGTPPTQARAISAGMFGTGFALRLARAEAEAIGGRLVRNGEILTLSLPLLCEKPDNDYSSLQRNGGNSAA